MDGSIDSESEATEVKRDSLAYVHTEVSRKEDIDHDLKVLLTPFPYLTHFSLSEGVVTIHSVTFFSTTMKHLDTTACRSQPLGTRVL